MFRKFFILLTLLFVFNSNILSATTKTNPFKSLQEDREELYKQFEEFLTKLTPKAKEHAMKYPRGSEKGRWLFIKVDKLNEQIESLYAKEISKIGPMLNQCYQKVAFYNSILSAGAKGNYSFIAEKKIWEKKLNKLLADFNDNYIKYEPLPKKFTTKDFLKKYPWLKKYEDKRKQKGYRVGY
jgi:hypothetical protein